MSRDDRPTDSAAVTDPAAGRGSAQEQPDRYDFIVVGSGAGGGPLAAKLALAGFTVLVLEAGGDHSCPYYEIPIMQAYASEDADMRWDFFVRHSDDETTQRADAKFQPGHDGVWYPRGSTLGGSTAISAMVTIYPHAKDWDDLAALTGDESWNAARMRELFQRLEAWRGVDAEPLPGDDAATRDRKAGHGRDRLARHHPRQPESRWPGTDVPGHHRRDGTDQPGPFRHPGRDTAAPRSERGRHPTGLPGHGLHSSGGARRAPQRQLGAAAAGGRPAPGPAADPAEHAGHQGAVRRHQGNRCRVPERAGLYRATPADAPHAPDTTMLAAQRVDADKEVILAGGAYNTPQLLMLSGVGPRGELDRLGIDTLVEAPGVGANLHDRYEVAVVAETDRDYPIFDGSALDVPTDPGSADPLFAEWQDDAGGPYSTNGSLAAIIAKSSAAAQSGSGPSDLIIFSLPIDFHGYYPGYAHDAVREHNRLSVLVLKGHTDNRAGTVTLSSSDPREVPVIRFRYFSEGSDGWQDDLDGVVDGIEVARDVLAHLTDIGATELLPGAQADTREKLRTFVEQQAWGHHACGTAKIGRDDDPMAVLDNDFRVRGVQNLRVVDASVFPDIPGFFIASAVYLISEKASDAVIAEYRQSGTPNAPTDRRAPLAEASEMR